jgi:hypothetical protein
VLLNLVLTFAVPTISVGGHVGGLLGGPLPAAAGAPLVGPRDVTDRVRDAWTR